MKNVENLKFIKQWIIIFCAVLLLHGAFLLIRKEDFRMKFVKSGKKIDPGKGSKNVAQQARQNQANVSMRSQQFRNNKKRLLENNNQRILIFSIILLIVFAALTKSDSLSSVLLPLLGSIVGYNFPRSN